MPEIDVKPEEAAVKYVPFVTYRNGDVIVYEDSCSKIDIITREGQRDEWLRIDFPTGEFESHRLDEIMQWGITNEADTVELSGAADDNTD